MNINFTDTAGTTAAVSTDTLVAALRAGKVFDRGNKKYFRTADRVCDVSTASVAAIDMDATDGTTVETTLTLIIEAVLLGRTVIRGTETYIRIGNKECLLSTAAAHV